MAAMLEIAELLRPPSDVADRFSAAVELMRRTFPFETVGVSFVGGKPPLVMSARRDRVARERGLAVVHAAMAFYSGRGSLENLDSLIRRSGIRWLCLPVLGDDKRLHGVLAASVGPAAADDAAVAVTACVAKHLGRMFDASKLAEAGRVTAEHAAAALAVESELSDLIGSTFDYMKMLSDLCDGVVSRVASGCVVRLEGADGVVRGVARASTSSPDSLPSMVGALAIEVMARRETLAAGAAYDVRAEPLVEDACSALGADWIACAPILAGDRALGALTVFGSLTHHPALSLALLESLAHRVAASIDKARLYAEATAAVQNREDVLSTVSHDLKNPLSVILMGAALVLETTGSHPAVERGHLQAIQRNARRMERLVNDLLDLASIDARALSIRPNVCHTRQVLDSALADARAAADDAGVVLVDAAPISLPCIWADESRITQVLMNLLCNAIKFTPRGGRVTLVAGRLSDGEFFCSVSDTGIGIAHEELPHIFERFWQAAPSAGRARGSGLGLAICKSLIELSGGRIWAESVLGMGTTVSFAMRAEDTPDAASA